MKLGIDIFSLRLQEWSAVEHLEYAHRLGVDLVHFSEAKFLDSLEEGYLRELKAQADGLGLSLEVGMGSICPTSNTFSDNRGSVVEQVERMLKVAQTLGSPVLRCYLGNNADRQGKLPLMAHIEATIDTCHAVKDLALELGVKLAIENHAGDLQGRELKMLIEQAGPDFVGACIDSGNPLWVAESPFVTLTQLAPYVVTSHIRDTAVWEHPQGAAVQWVAMGEGNVGIADWSEQFMAHCPDIPFTLEIITGMAPKVLNYLEPEFWQAYPNMPAQEFVQFLRLTKAGAAYLGPMLTAPWVGYPPEYQTALAAQQRLDLERSVAYCRETLQIG